MSYYEHLSIKERASIPNHLITGIGSREISRVLE